MTGHKPIRVDRQGVGAVFPVKAPRIGNTESGEEVYDKFTYIFMYPNVFFGSITLLWFYNVFCSNTMTLYTRRDNCVIYCPRPSS